MNTDWTAWLSRWTEAGLIDPETATRIRAFEQEHVGSTRLRWPILIALGFGGLMIGGGVLLFVAAHWDALSPTFRFVLVLLMVGGFHAGGAFAADRFPGMSSTLHAIGTVALGAGVALAGQIFNLDEHWPGGLMMWAAGAAIGWAVLRDVPQFVLMALVAPSWLVAEWFVASRSLSDVRDARILAAGVAMLALTYFTAARHGDRSERHRALVWIGGIALIPAALFLAVATWPHEWYGGTRLTSLKQTIAWIVAIGLPLLLAYVLRDRAAWMNAAATLWLAALIGVSALGSDLSLFVWWAAGASALVAWGVADGRSERVNMGSVLFAGTVLAFYFSKVMDKLGRSASLVGLGLLFLAGGWALERMRRRLVQQARESR
jgi:MFS family permease